MQELGSSRNMINPHYERLLVTYPKHFDPIRLRIGWLALLGVVGLNLLASDYSSILFDTFHYFYGSKLIGYGSRIFCVN